MVKKRRGSRKRRNKEGGGRRWEEEEERRGGGRGGGGEEEKINHHNKRWGTYSSAQFQNLLCILEWRECSARTRLATKVKGIEHENSAIHTCSQLTFNKGSCNSAMWVCCLTVSLIVFGIIGRHSSRIVYEGASTEKGWPWGISSSVATLGTSLSVL